MKLRIFYSWQSTTERKYNMHFIEEAIKDAIKIVKKTIDTPIDEILLDRDTKGIAGMPPIAETIEEKIKLCDIFIADLSIINKEVRKDNFGARAIYFLLDKIVKPQPTKPLLSNNVSIELGQAIKSVGKNQIIAITNTIYGKPAEDPETIPFDIRHLRWPMEYSLDAKSWNRKNEIKKALSTELAKAIQTIIQSNLERQKEQYYPFQTWGTWSNHFEEANQYFKNEKVEAFIKTIQLEGNEPKKILRITGLSGLGKTRMVYEAFKPNKSDTTSLALSNRVLYYDVYSDHESQQIIDKVIKLANDGERKILVFDNANISLHNKLIEIIKRKNNLLTIITIDSNPIVIEEKIGDTIYLELTREDSESIITNILKNSYPGLPEPDLERIKEFAQGFPMMATLLAEDRLRGEVRMGIIKKPDLLNKLLGKYSDGEERKILRACAIFTRIGFEGDLSQQIQFIAGSKLITSLDLDAEVSKDRFYEICKQLKKRGIFEQQGRYIAMRPKPLAISLAAEWWENCRQEKVETILEQVRSIGLGEPLCDQMRMLDFLPEAKDLVKGLCGEQGPFGKAEVLNTPEGSRLFRSLVEVNPEVTADTLVRLFATASTDDLLKIDSGRRNLVWALEKLCFREQTFERATKVLLAFAVAENENISNNATGQFIQLFQVLLPGTEANLDHRWNIIQYTLSKDDKKHKELALSALSRGLLYHHFHRMGGSEKQGSQAPLKDYHPKNITEVNGYWRNILNTLGEIAITPSEFSSRAIEIVASHIRELCLGNAAHLVVDAIKKISPVKNWIWPEALSGLKMALKYEAPHIKKEDRENIKELIKALTPTDFENVYRNTIGTPRWEDFDDSKGFTETAIEKSQELAVKFLTEKLDWETYMPLFYQGDQQQAYYFGKEIAKEIEQLPNEINRFFSLSIRTLKSLPKEVRNVTMMAGFLSEVSNENKKRFYKEILNDNELHVYAFYLSSASDPDLEDLTNLLSLVDEEKATISSFLTFKYGRALDHLATEDVIALGERIARYGKNGLWTSLSILYMYCFNNKQNWERCKDSIKTIIESDNLLIVDEESTKADFHEWSESIRKLLKENRDEDFAAKITSQIIEFCAQTDFLFSIDIYLRNILLFLFENYFHNIWPIISKALLSERDNYWTYHHLKNLLGSHIEFQGDREGILFKGDEEVIFQWCEQNTPLAPVRIAGMVTIFERNENGGVTWNPFTRRIIDSFGNIKEVLSELGANMGTYSWTGSVVPFLVDKKSLLMELQNHHFEEVKTWAMNQIPYLEAEIKRERYDDEERYLE